MIVLFTFLLLFYTSSDLLESARQALFSGNSDKAIELLLSVDVNERTTHWHEIAAPVYMSLEDYSNAIESYRVLLDEEQATISNRFQYGVALRAFGLSDEAREQHQHILREDDKYWPSIRQLAAIFMDEHKWRNAVLLFERLITQYPENIQFYLRLADAHRQSGDLGKSVMVLEQAREIDSAHPALLQTLAVTYYRAGYLPESLTIINEALEVNPRSIYLNRLKADVLFRSQQHRKALEHYDFVISRGIENALVYRNAGISSYRLEQFEEAWEYLRKSHEISSDDFNTAYYAGLALKSLNQPIMATVYFAFAAESLNLDMLGNIALQTAATAEEIDDYEQALLWYQRAYVIDPANSELLYRIAFAKDKNYGADPRTLSAYRKFINIYREENEEIIAYAHQRIRQITERLHFQMANESGQ